MSSRRTHSGTPLAPLVGLLIAWTAGTSDAAGWEIQAGAAVASVGSRCSIRSATETLSDGYQDVKAHIVVTPDAILVRTESPLDPGFSDIGLQVDRNEFVSMDSVFQDKSARFSKEYPQLVQQFEKGRVVRAQLRFWPTWPVTGTHSAVFSLVGFTKAYEGMRGACHP
jgi:hypothetical protein